MTELFDKPMRDAVAARLKRFVERKVAKHATAIMETPSGQRATEIAGYAFGVVTGRELDVDVDDPEFSRVFRRGTQLGRAIRKGTVNE